MRHKYNAVKTTVDGIKFDSKAEARRYGELKILEASKQIEDLTLKPTFPINVNGKLVCKYIADFQYYDPESGGVIVEDVKSKPTKTPVYRLKKKLVFATYGIEIKEVC